MLAAKFVELKFISLHPKLNTLRVACIFVAKVVKLFGETHFMLVKNIPIGRMVITHIEI